jgi:hypothetical protein
MGEQPNFKRIEELKKENLAKAVKAWNEVALQGEHELPYTLDQALEQPYLMTNWYRDKEGRKVSPRLYQQDEPQSNEFVLFANGGDTAILLDIMEKLLQKGVHVVRIAHGHGSFESMSEEQVNTKVVELKNRYLNI